MGQIAPHQADAPHTQARPHPRELYHLLYRQYIEPLADVQELVEALELDEEEKTRLSYMLCYGQK